MRATQANLLMFVSGNKQFEVPIYQRRYDWSEKECEQLWNDILGAGADESILSYFLGSIVYIKEDNHHISSLMERCYLIDGQQRLATVSLLLAALGEAIEAESVEIGINKTNLQHLYLFNTNVPDDSYRYKYLLTTHDKETLNRLLDNRLPPTNPSDRLLENYRFFEKKLQPQNLKTVYEGIKKLEIVDILLERVRKDNPQLIFESINSTGTQLTDADLIRNYIFMGQTLDFQTRLYSDWHNIEERFGKEFIKQFDVFIMTYVTLQTKEYLNQGDVYEKFKKMVSDKKGTNKKEEDVLEETIKEMDIYSKYYARAALLQEDDPELLACFKDLHVLNVKTVWVFVLGVYEDYMQKKLQKSEFIDLLRLIESYIVRRIICDMHTKNPRRLFVQLISGIDKSDYLESLKCVFAKMPQAAAYPSDDEFKEQFCIKDVYNISLPIRKYLLGKMEHHENNKEPVSLENCTVERVMPEKLNEEWKKELGEGWEATHRLYLGRLGNLTLTGNNPKLGNKPFREKRDMPGGFRDSPLRLNKSLAQAKQWNEDAIKNRAETLSEKALKIWTDHDIDGSITDENWGLYPHLVGEMRDIFLRLRQRIINLDASSITEKRNKSYIAYSLNTNFVGIVPQASRLQVQLKIPFREIDDPKDLCRDVKLKGTYFGVAEVEVGLDSYDLLDYIMSLIDQAFKRQLN